MVNKIDLEGRVAVITGGAQGIGDGMAGESARDIGAGIGVARTHGIQIGRASCRERVCYPV